MHAIVHYLLICSLLAFTSSLAIAREYKQLGVARSHRRQLRRSNETSKAVFGYFNSRFLTFLLLEPPGMRVPEMHHLFQRTVLDLPHDCAQFKAMDVSSPEGRSVSFMLFGSLRPGLSLLRRGQLLTGVVSDKLEHVVGRAWQECRDGYWKFSAFSFLQTSASFQRSFVMDLARHLENLPWEDMAKNTSRARPYLLGGYYAPHSGWARAGVRSSSFSLAWTDIHSDFQRIIIVTDAFRIRRQAIPRRAKGKLFVLSVAALHALHPRIAKHSWFILCPLRLGALVESARWLATSEATFDVAIMRSNQKQARLVLRAPPKPQPGNPARVSWLLWLHVPKTGTSFARTIYKYACKQWSTSRFMKLPNASKPEHFDNELAWSADLNCIPGMLSKATSSLEQDVVVPGLAPGQHMHRGQVIHRLLEFPGRAATMLRKPMSRIKSAFRSLLGHGEPAELYLCGSCGLNFDGHVPTQLAIAKSILRGQIGFVEFANLEHTRSCYAKLLLGTTCLPINAVELATKRLREDFIFIGLAEHWALSVCLFHAMLDGRQPQDIEFQNSRPTPSAASGFQVEHMDAAVDDPIDEAIYAEAAAIFEQNVAAFRFEVRRLGPLCVNALAQRV